MGRSAGTGCPARWTVPALRRPGCERPRGRLSRMRWDLLGANDEQTYVLVLAPGDEIIASLSAFATERGLDAARFTAIGGLDDVTLGYFDREVRDYVHL